MSTKELPPSTPYDELFEYPPTDAIRHRTLCNASSVQSKYRAHRENRNNAQREKLLSGELTSLAIDPVLEKLAHPSLYPDFEDERHCLVFWARPPRPVRLLIKTVQERLKRHAHKLCPMPPENLHMTVLEIAHSLTKSEMDALVEKILPKLEEITDYTYEHRARLIRPMVSYDASAVALSFETAAGEGSGYTDKNDDTYTYHHLRRELYLLSQSTGVEVASRYVVPSAHLTLGRFVTNEDHATEGQEGLDMKKMKAWLKTIDDTNEWLKENYWPAHRSESAPGGEWVVGQEKGLSCQAGTIWYGAPDDGKLGSATLRVGKGFPISTFDRYALVT